MHRDVMSGLVTEGEKKLRKLEFSLIDKDILVLMVEHQDDLGGFGLTVQSGYSF